MAQEKQTKKYELLISLYDGKAVASVVQYGNAAIDPRVVETHEKIYDSTRQNDQEYLSYIYKTFYKEVTALFSVHYNHIETTRMYLFVSFVSHFPRQANLEKKAPFTISEELLGKLFQSETSFAQEHATFAQYPYVPLETVCLGIVCDTKRTYLFPHKAFSCAMDIYTGYIPAWYKEILERIFGEQTNTVRTPLHIESGFVPLVKALVALFPDQPEFSLLIPGLSDVEYVSFSNHLLNTHVRVPHTLPEIALKYEKVYTRLVTSREHQTNIEKISALLSTLSVYDTNSPFLRPLFIIGDTPFSAIAKSVLTDEQNHYLPITIADQVGHIALSDRERKEISSIITSMILISRG